MKKELVDEQLSSLLFVEVNRLRHLVAVLKAFVASKGLKDESIAFSNAYFDEKEKPNEANSND